MGYLTDKIVGQAPRVEQKPPQITDSPEFQAAVAKAIAEAKAGVQGVTPPPGYRWADAKKTRLVPIAGGPADKAPQPLTPDQKNSAREDIVNRIILARQLKETTKGLTGTGALGPFWSYLPIGGTRTKDAEAIASNLKQKGALASILDLLKQTGGKNPFTPMSQGETEIISGAKMPPIGVGLSDEVNIQSANEIERLGKKAYRSLGFSDAQLKADLERLSGRAQASNQANAGVKVERVR